MHCAWVVCPVEMAHTGNYGTSGKVGKNGTLSILGYKGENGCLEKFNISVPCFPIF